MANGRVEDKVLMDYVLIENRMIGRLKDVHVYKRMVAGMSDHYMVEARVIVAKEWCGRVAKCRREVVRIEGLRKPEKNRSIRKR